MDTDDDKVSDGKEILIGTDPLVYAEIFDVTATAEDEDSVIVSTQVELLGEQVKFEVKIS